MEYPKGIFVFENVCMQMLCYETIFIYIEIELMYLILQTKRKAKKKRLKNSIAESIVFRLSAICLIITELAFHFNLQQIKMYVLLIAPKHFALPLPAWSNKL